MGDSENTQVAEAESDNITDLFESLYDNLIENGKVNTKELAQFTRERVEHLSKITNTTERSKAAIVEKQNILLKAGINTTHTADAADNTIGDVIFGALYIAAGLVI
ncbi:MAG: hypothetical protein PVI90_11735 [Desulfobacteraceae bacterium]|jgi:hypothetical protein